MAAYHQRTTAQIDLERKTLLTLKTMSRECSESAWTSFVLDPAGLVFATPRDAGGNFLVGSADQPAWDGLIGYARESDRLIKKIDRFGTPSEVVPEPLTLTPPRDVAWFASSSLLSRVVQTGVEQFQVTRQTVGDEDGQDVLRIELGAGVGEAPRRFSLRLSTTVRPRN